MNNIKNYDDIIIGSGISGLTTALLLALNNRRVLIIEKSERLGGALRRFYHKGAFWDSGLHFIGGFKEGEPLDEMLKILGIKDRIAPFIEEINYKYIFEDTYSSVSFSSGIDAFFTKLCKLFVLERDNLISYFQSFKQVFFESKGLRVQDFISNNIEFIKEDEITLQQVLDDSFKDPYLKAILSNGALCYGVAPSEISFANHIRISYLLYNSLARIKNGGDIIFESFMKRFKELDVHYKTNSFIKEFGKIENKHASSIVLNSKEELNFKNLAFMIHPKEILKVIPEEHFTKAFRTRINDFESSMGFISVHGILDLEDESAYSLDLMNIYPDNNIDALFKKENHYGGLCFLQEYDDKLRKYKFTILESIHVNELKKWQDSTSDLRSSDYCNFKRKKTEEIIKRVEKALPALKGAFKSSFTATPLTYRDYLNNYDGSAYGVKQKIGQFNLLGHLKIRNIFVAGQSSLLPGIVGSMISSFLIGSHILGKDVYKNFINSDIA